MTKKQVYKRRIAQITAWVRKKRIEARKKGNCVRCFKYRRQPPFTKCNDCLDHDREYCMKLRRKAGIKERPKGRKLTRKQLAERQRAKVKKLLKAGLCVRSCGRKIAKSSKSRCLICLKKAAKETGSRKKKKKK